MDFPTEQGHFLKMRFYFGLLKAVLLNMRMVASERLGWKSSLFLLFILSKAKDKNRLKNQLTGQSARPMLRNLAYNIFLISQRTRFTLGQVGDEMQIEIVKKGVTYKFELIGLPNKAKAPFVHNLTPLTDIFFLGLYDIYDYRGGVVVDIGGYIGDTAVYFAKNGAREVYSYEPNPVNYQYLVKNINLNGVTGRVKAYNRAVSIVKRPLVVRDKAGAGSLYSDSKTGTSYDIDNVKPNDLLHNHRTISLLKVDCKGCEKELFDASISQVSKKVQSVIIDAGRLNAEENVKLISKLLNAGFSSDVGPGEALYFRNLNLLEDAES